VVLARVPWSQRLGEAAIDGRHRRVRGLTGTVPEGYSQAHLKPTGTISISISTILSRSPSRAVSVWLLWAIGYALFPALLLAQAHWPQFRGPGGLGVAEGDDFPTVFGPGTNLVWRIALLPGHSSPCIWGDRIFVTGFADADLQTLGLDRRTGTRLWQGSVTAERTERGGIGGQAAPTPATDGERVYSYFGPFGVVAYDLDGQELWRQPLPLPVTQHGVGSSPVLAGEWVVLLRDQDVGSHILALDRRTGRLGWRSERPGFRRSFSTPLVWRVGEVTQLIVTGTLRVVAYNALDGNELWSARGVPNELCASAVAGGGLVYAGGWTHGSGVARMPVFDDLLTQGDRDQNQQLTREEAPNGPARQHFQYIDADKDGQLTREEYESMAEIFGQAQNALLAIRLGGTGDLTETHVAWRQTRGLPYVPCPLLYRERVYLVKNGGLVSCLSATDGVALYQEERLGVLGDYYASPVAAGGKICVISQPGTAVVFAAGDTLEVLARNPLGEKVMATPAMAGGRLYVRSQDHLWAFGAP